MSEETPKYVATDSRDEQPQPLGEMQRIQEYVMILRAGYDALLGALAPFRKQYVQPGYADDCTVMLRTDAGTVRLIKQLLEKAHGG